MGGTGKAVTLGIGALMLVTPGCGSSGADDERGQAQARPTMPAQNGDAYAQQFVRTKLDEPDVDIPSGPPPKRLRVHDRRRGEGAPIERGDEVAVNYVGALWSTGEDYDSSYEDKRPVEVTPGHRSFIDGFELGIVGMRVGGLRQITIPPRLGYGKLGYAPDVKPGETLVFVVDVEAILNRRE